VLKRLIITFTYERFEFNLSLHYVASRPTNMSAKKRMDLLPMLKHESHLHIVHLFISK